jgi:hypothetical protein
MSHPRLFPRRPKVHDLGTHRTRNRRLVVTLLFAALPYSAIFYSAIFESDLGYVLNIVLGLVAVAFALAVRPEPEGAPDRAEPAPVTAA